MGYYPSCRLGRCKSATGGPISSFSRCDWMAEILPDCARDVLRPPGDPGRRCHMSGRAGHHWVGCEHAFSGDCAVTKGGCGSCRHGTRPGPGGCGWVTRPQHAARRFWSVFWLSPTPRPRTRCAARRRPQQLRATPPPTRGCAARIATHPPPHRRACRPTTRRPAVVGAGTPRWWWCVCAHLDRRRSPRWAARLPGPPPPHRHLVCFLCPPRLVSLHLARPLSGAGDCLVWLLPGQRAAPLPPRNGVPPRPLGVIMLTLNSRGGGSGGSGSGTTGRPATRHQRLSKTVVSNVDRVMEVCSVSFDEAHRVLQDNSMDVQRTIERFVSGMLAVGSCLPCIFSLLGAACAWLCSVVCLVLLLCVSPLSCASFCRLSCTRTRSVDDTSVLPRHAPKLTWLVRVYLFGTCYRLFGCA